MIDITRVLHTAFFTPAPEGFWGLNVLLWGPPGAAKTSIIRQLCTDAGLHCERLSPAERGEGQFGVVPVPGADGYLYYPAPAWACAFAKGGVLFLDEINTAPPALQAPLLGLSQLRTLGAHVFGVRTRVIAAANEVRHAAGGWDLAPAMANRFCHLDFDGVPARQWATSLLTGFGRDTTHAAAFDALAEEARVMAAWPVEIARARGLVSAFVQANPVLLHVKPRTEDPAASRAWPSRRSWEYVTHALAGAAIHGLDAEETQVLIRGFVGEAAAIEFTAWMQSMDLPDPVALLDGQAAWRIEPDRLDRTFAVLSIATALVKPSHAERRDARATVLWGYVDQLLNIAPDVALVFACALLSVEGGQVAAMPPASFATIARTTPLLKAAGYRPGGSR